MDNFTVEKWNNLHTQKRFQPKYPSEAYVQFVFKNFKRDNSEKVLDLGCGAGRHVFFLASEGIECYGTDISNEGINYVKSLIHKKNLNAELVVSPTKDLPFEDNFFNGIMSYGVLYYMDIADIKKSINEIYRTLKKSGKGFIVVRSTEDYRFGQGKEFEPNTFRLETETDTDKNASNESGMIMHFFTREELVEYFKIFKNVIIDRLIVTHDNETYCDNDYILTFEK